MNKISDRIEGIFAHAVAMEQSGRLKSTVYCMDNEIFIMNSDNTVLLRFLLRRTETPFAHPVSFRANDYDSKSFYEKDGKIVFVTETDGFIRTKSCSTPGDTPADIKALFDGYEKITSNRISFKRDILSLLDDSLSHVEISAPNHALSLVQRNIYSGSIIEVRRKKEEGLGNLVEVDDITDEFGPVGIRTNDFAALFTFVDILNMNFGEAGYCYVKSIDPKLHMEGIIAKCIYDELGSVEKVEKERPKRPAKTEETATTKRRCR